MNLEMLMGLSGLMLRPESQGEVNSGFEAIGSFSEIMEALTAQLSKQGGLVSPQDSDTPTANAPSTWLETWLNTLEQTGDRPSVNLDTAEEAAHCEREVASVSLTELMAALQPFVNQSLTTPFIDLEGGENQGDVLQ